MLAALRRATRHCIRALMMEGGEAATQKQARDLLTEAIGQHNCALAFMRLALHDSLTFDQATRTGGANASIRTPKELSHRGNEGLQAAIDVLQPIKQQLPGMSFADLIQLAGALGLEAAGGPAVPFTAGRRDSKVYPPEGRLPIADKNQDGMAQFWQCFKRTGLSNKDALALLGSHPFGDSWRDAQSAEARPAADQPRFSNHFFRHLLEVGGNGAPAVLADPAMRAQAEAWAANADLYTEDFAVAWQRASELGMLLSKPRPAASAQDTVTVAQVAVAVVAAGALAAAAVWYGRRRRQGRGLFA